MCKLPAVPRGGFEARLDGATEFDVLKQVNRSERVSYNALAIFDNQIATALGSIFQGFYFFSFLKTEHYLLQILWSFLAKHMVELIIEAKARI